MFIFMKVTDTKKNSTYIWLKIFPSSTYNINYIYIAALVITLMQFYWANTALEPKHKFNDIQTNLFFQILLLFSLSGLLRSEEIYNGKEKLIIIVIKKYIYSTVSVACQKVPTLLYYIFGKNSINNGFLY